MLCSWLLASLFYFWCSSIPEAAIPSEARLWQPKPTEAAVTSVFSVEVVSTSGHHQEPPCRWAGRLTTSTATHHTTNATTTTRSWVLLRILRTVCAVRQGRQHPKHVSISSFCLPQHCHVTTVYWNEWLKLSEPMPCLSGSQLGGPAAMHLPVLVARLWCHTIVHWRINGSSVVCSEEPGTDASVTVGPQIPSSIQYATALTRL